MTTTTRLIAVIMCCGLAPLAMAQPDPRENFDRWDTNRDGVLSREELPEGVRGNFNRLDANSDGDVSRDEHDEFVRRFVRPNQTPPRRGPMIPDTVTAMRDLSYAGTDHPRQRLDLFVPKKPASEKLPLVVFIHGGGWLNGDKAGGAGVVWVWVFCRLALEKLEHAGPAEKS